MALRDDPRIVEFEAQVRIKAEELTAFIIDGRCTSYDDYKRRTGQIKGLHDAVDIMREVLTNYGKEDQDDD